MNCQVSCVERMNRSYEACRDYCTDQEGFSMVTGVLIATLVAIVILAWVIDSFMEWREERKKPEEDEIHYEDGHRYW